MDEFVKALKVIHDQNHETDKAILHLIEELVSFVDKLNTQVNDLELRIRLLEIENREFKATRQDVH